MEDGAHELPARAVSSGKPTIVADFTSPTTKIAAVSVFGSGAGVASEGSWLSGWRERRQLMPPSSQIWYCLRRLRLLL